MCHRLLFLRAIFLKEPSIIRECSLQKFLQDLDLDKVEGKANFLL